MNVMASGFGTGGVKTINANGRLIHYAEAGAGWRYATLLDKEPETIEWIDGFEQGDTFWDIGANVGIYSIYAAARGIRTMAFEPHFANYHQFCITIALNGLQDLVTPLCLAFAEAKSIAEMNLASLDIGTSMSNFGEALDFRGQPFEPAFRQGMVGYDIDSFIADFGIEIPTHLKIDVDGIELPIIRGARKMLTDQGLQSVSIELIESDEAQVSAVTEILESAGLHFIHKKQNIAFATPQTTDVLNYLFHRDPAKLADRVAEIKVQGLQAAEDGKVTIDQLVSQIVDRIKAAPVDPAPSGNIFMEDMFPANVYDELLARLPDDHALDPIIHPDAIAEDGRRTRYLLDLTQASLARLTPEDRPFWQAMIDVFTAPELTGAIIAKFAPTLRERFGDAMPELVAVPILYRDFPGYRIGIHPDTARKIATLQFYLPEDGSQAHLGTSFHQRTASGFERLKTNIFKPNSAYGFVRTEESWHSVDQLGPDEKVRNTIAVTFYIKGQEYRSAPQPSEGTIASSDVYTPDMSAALRTLAKTFTSREDVATLFPEDGVGIELGAANGALSERVLHYDHIGYVFSIDSWAGDYGVGVDHYREAIARLSPLRDRNTIMRLYFSEALELFGDASVDFIYVNGYARDGELTAQLLRTWYAKLRPGGIIIGDDYSVQWPLIVAAVDDFVAANGLELHVIEGGENGPAESPGWFAMKP